MSIKLVSKRRCISASATRLAISQLICLTVMLLSLTYQVPTYYERLCPSPQAVPLLSCHLLDHGTLPSRWSWHHLIHSDIALHQLQIFSDPPSSRSYQHPLNGPNGIQGLRQRRPCDLTSWHPYTLLKHLHIHPDASITLSPMSTKGRFRKHVR